MRYHTFDENVLHTNSGNFELQAKVPKEFNVPQNPDGTTAEMTATFEGETLFGSTSVAMLIGKDVDNLAEVVLQAAAERLKLPHPLRDERFTALHEKTQAGADLTQTEDETLLEEFHAFFQQYIGWERMHINLSAKTEEDAETEYKLKLSLYAPGYAAMLHLLAYVTDSETLTSVIASQMPLDEYYHGEEF